MFSSHRPAVPPCGQIHGKEILFQIRISRSRGLENLLPGIETVQSGPPYVLTDPIKVILFIKIVVSSWEVSCQYSLLNRNYEIAGRQETLAVLKPHKPFCIESVGWAGHKDTMRTNRNKTGRPYRADKLGLFHLFENNVCSKI